jgi:hypothetical protein
MTSLLGLGFGDGGDDLMKRVSFHALEHWVAWYMALGGPTNSSRGQNVTLGGKLGLDITLFKGMFFVNLNFENVKGKLEEVDLPNCVLP